MTSVDPSPDENIPTRRPDLEWVELDGEVVLYDPGAHTLHRLNAGAAAVWAACDGAAAQEYITRAIEETYSGPRGAIERDVPAIIAEFRRLNLLLQSPAESDDAR
jgi:Coenzyme PQQ synthesis protein D (PqqD)